MGLAIELVLLGLLALLFTGPVVLSTRTALLAAVIAVVTAATSSYVLVVGAPVLLVLVVLDVVLAGPVRAIGLVRDGATAGRLGEPVEIALTLTAAGSRRLRADVRDAWPPSANSSPRSHRVSLAGGERRRLVTTLVPDRRGDREPARITIRSYGPLGLASRQGRHVVPWRLRVLPPFTSRRLLPEKLIRLRQVEGQVSLRGSGRGTEFDRLREYVPGDDVRQIDWRTTARTQTVAVRTYRPERDRRVVLVLDTGRTSAARVGDEPRLDRALDAALLLTALAQRAGDRVEMVAHDVITRAEVRPRTGDALPTLVDVMAQLQPALLESDPGALVTLLLSRLKQRALVVLFTDLSGAGVEERLRPVLPALTRRHMVLIAAVSDPDVVAMTADRADPAAVYGAAAAERALLERRRLAALLRRTGAEVVDAPPAGFASAVADAYLDLKAAGRL